MICLINLSKKLYISIFAFLLAFIVVGTTTFAWLKLNPNAFFDELSIQLDTSGDLRISVVGDDDSYKNNLDNTDMKYAVVAKRLSEKGYKLKCTKNADKTLSYYFVDDSNNNVSVDVDAEYSKLKLAALTSSDGVTFRNKFDTVMRDGYLSFDIYFKSDTNSTQTVYFSNREIAYEEYVIPKTEIVVKEAISSDDLIDKIHADFSTYDMLTGTKLDFDVSNKNTFDYKEGIEEYYPSVYANEAARFSIYTTVNDVENFNGIYEIDAGHGSYATKDMTDAIYSNALGARYDASKNAALTYYNNYILSNEDNEQRMNEVIHPTLKYLELPETYKGLDTEEAAEILVLNEGNHWGANGRAKMTMSLWLEGWDADCVDFVLDQELAIRMSFTNSSTVIEHTSVDLTYRVTDPNSGMTVSEKTRKQIIGLPISDDAPAFVEGNTTKKFVGWRRIVNGVADAELWDFSQPVSGDKDTDAARTWVLESVWE